MHGKHLFRAAALFNILVGLGFLLGRSVLAPLVHLDPVTGTNVLITNLAALLILTFGLSYAVIATDTVRYRPMILIGIAGKSLAVAAALQFLWSTGGQNWHLPALAAGDLVFVGLFWRFYRSGLRG